MQSLEAACDEGERAVKRLKALRAASLPLAIPKEESQASTCDFEEKSGRFDIFEELERLHDEDETDSDDDEQSVQYKSLILEKLVKRERLNTVILNLYPGNKGYSLAFRVQDRARGAMCFKEGTEDLIQTMTQSYEEDTILRYVDKEEIPPFVLDALDKFDFLFYSGCVIAEVRNYRQAYPENRCYVHHVLLRPTQKTILADINTLTRDRPDFTAEDRDAIESQIVMAHAPDLCLDPDPSLEDKLATVRNRSRFWNEHPFRKMARRASQVAACRKRKLDHFTHRHGLELMEFCKAKRSKTTTATTKCNKAAPPEETKTVIPIPHLEGPLLSPPAHSIVINEFKSRDWPKGTTDCTPILYEVYTLEADIKSNDREVPRVYHIRLSVFRRPSNAEYVGQIYADRDYTIQSRNGVSCVFSLGCYEQAKGYMYQFASIFAEDGRKEARIRCVHPTDKPSTLITPLQLQQLCERWNPLQAQTYQPLTNGVVQGVQPVQIQQAHLQALQARKLSMSNQELEIDALATKLEISSQQFQAAEKAKRQQAAAAAAAAQHQKLLSNSNIISLLNSSPASNANSDASAAVVNAINNVGVVQQPRLVTRRMTLSNVAGARVLNHGNLITLNNHGRVNLQDLNVRQLGNASAQTVTLTAAAVNNATRVNLNAQLANAQPQTVTLTSVNSGGGSYSYTTMPVKQQLVHHQRIVPSSPHQEGSGGESALGALLVGTPAADRPEIASPNQANSLLLEKLAASSGAGGQNPFAQTPKTPQATAQFVVQSPKAKAVISPMSSPPPQASNTLNVQSLNLTQLQSIPGLHNVQFQLQNFTQPISLALNVGGQLSGGTASQGILMSLPGTQAQQSVAAQGSNAQPVQGVVVNASGGNAGPSQLAHLVSSGNLKNITHHNIRTASGSQTLQLTPGTPQFQLISQLQRPTRQQTLPAQAAISARTLQRTPITIKMAPSSNQPVVDGVQHYQQLCIGQQKGLEGVFDKLRRSSNE